MKPPNLLVDRHMQEVKLADFGVSKILEASGYAGVSKVQFMCLCLGEVQVIQIGVSSVRNSAGHTGLPSSRAGLRKTLWTSSRCMGTGSLHFDLIV